MEVKPEKQESLLKDLSDILTWVERLDEIDTDGVEPLTHMSAEINNIREDKATNSLTKADALKLAPNHDQNFFLVPKVIKTRTK
ncbi:MAG: Asp-tRNA(Asn)/Glu-tRNA(Gln) amidotransferase subunit GatC [Cyclobacteriaceae bacterium]